MEHSSLTVTATCSGRGCTVAISGDLDLTTAEALAPAVTQVLGAVNGQPAPVLLDLSGLAFLDCVGARALAAAVQALPSGHPVAIGSISPAASRLLGLIGWNLECLPPIRPMTASQKAANRPAGTPVASQVTVTDQQARLTLAPVGSQPAVSEAALPSSNDTHVHDLLAVRAVIEQAKGIVMATYRCGADEASDLLHKTSKGLGVKVYVLATRVVNLAANGASIS